MSRRRNMSNRATCQIERLGIDTRRLHMSQYPPARKNRRKWLCMSSFVDYAYARNDERVVCKGVAEVAGADEKCVKAIAGPNAKMGINGASAQLSVVAGLQLQ